MVSDMASYSLIKESYIRKGLKGCAFDTNIFKICSIQICNPIYS